MRLVREFVEESLYARGYGFFQRKRPTLAASPSIDLAHLRSESDYLRKVTAHCQDGQAWPTPSTLWQPWYGRILGNTLPRRHIIYEIGPGQGQLCQSMLREFDDIQEYHLIERSDQLREQLRESFASVSKVRIHESIPEDDRQCSLIMCEVLDNCPHDLVRTNRDGSLSQAYIAANSEARYGNQTPALQFVFAPSITDPLIQRCTETMEAFKPGYFATKLADRLLDVLNLWDRAQKHRCHFVPTGAVSLLESIRARLPNSSCLVVDFDSLPDVVTGFASLAPVVQTIYSRQFVQQCLGLKDNVENGSEVMETIHLETMLVKPGVCDIFFPTNFAVLEHVFRTLWPGRNIISGKHRTLLKAFPQVLAKTTCPTGYNPMLATFGNLSFLLCK